MCVHWLIVWVLICSVCIFVRFYLHFPSMFACGRFAGLVGWSSSVLIIRNEFFRSFMSIARFKGIRFRLFCIQWRRFCIHAHDNSDCRFKGEGELLELPWNKSYIEAEGKNRWATVSWTTSGVNSAKVKSALRWAENRWHIKTIRQDKHCRSADGMWQAHILFHIFSAAWCGKFVLEKLKSGWESGRQIYGEI